MTLSVSNLGIDGLEDIQQIGAGGSSRVYRARQADLDRIVAIKVLNPGHDQNVAKRFDRERKAMGRLSLHEGIVPVYSSGLTTHNEPYLVMPYYANGSLQDQIDTGALEWETAVSYVDVAAETIAEAHDEGVVHLDLKPANILLTNSGAPRIADFGIAKLTSGQGASAGTTQGAAFTPAYSAPETFLDGETGPPSDVYGLGATLWALLVGHPPFLTPGDDTNLMAVIGRVVNNPVGDLRHFTPASICDVIERAMAKRPEDRYQTAREFSTALKTAAASEASPAFAAQSESKRPTAFFPGAGNHDRSSDEQTNVRTRIDAVDLPSSIAVGGAAAGAGAAGTMAAAASISGSRPLLEETAQQTSAAVGVTPPPTATPILDIDLDRFRFGPILIGVLAFLGVIAIAFFGLNRGTSTQADGDVSVTVTVPAAPEISDQDDDPTALAGDGTVVSSTTAATTSPTTDPLAGSETTEAATTTTEVEQDQTTTTVEEEETTTTEAEEEQTTTTVEEEETTTTVEETTTTTVEETTTTTPEPVAPPTGLTATPAGDEVSLSWSAPATGPTPASYRVYRNGAFIGGSPQTSYTDDSGLAEGTYSYTVRSVDDDSEVSADSASASVTIEAVPPDEPNPTSVDATATASIDEVAVSFSADECFTGYRLRAVLSGPGDPTLPVIKDLSPACNASAEDTIGGLLPDRTYTISVTVWRSDPSDGISTQRTVRTLAQP